MRNKVQRSLIIHRREVVLNSDVQNEALYISSELTYQTNVFQHLHPQHWGDHPSDKYQHQHTQPWTIKTNKFSTLLQETVKHCLSDIIEMRILVY